MRKIFIPLIIAGSMIIFGCGLFVIIMSVNSWDFTKLNTSKYEENEYVVNEEFNDIEINTDTADINIMKSTDNKTRILIITITVNYRISTYYFLKMKYLIGKINN